MSVIPHGHSPAAAALNQLGPLRCGLTRSGDEQSVLAVEAANHARKKRVLVLNPDKPHRQQEHR